MKQKYFALIFAMCVGLTCSAQEQKCSRPHFFNRSQMHRMSYTAKVDRNDIVDNSEGYTLSSADLDQDKWSAASSENSPGDIRFNRVLVSNVSAGDTVYVKMRVRDNARAFLKSVKSRDNFSVRNENRRNHDMKLNNSFSQRRHSAKFNCLSITEDENGEEKTMKFLVTEGGKFFASNMFNRWFTISSVKISPELETTSADNPARTQNKNDREWIHYATGFRVANPIRGEVYIHEGKKVVYNGQLEANGNN